MVVLVALIVWKLRREKGEDDGMEESKLRELECKVGEFEPAVEEREPTKGNRKLTLRKMKMKPVVREYCMEVLGEHKKHLGTFLNLTNREGMGDRVWRQESDLLRRRRHMNGKDNIARGSEGQ